MVIEALIHMRHTGAELLPIYNDGRVTGYVTFVDLTNFLCDEEDGGDLRAHKLNFDLGTAMIMIREIRIRKSKTPKYLKPVLTFTLVMLSVALLFSKPLTKFIRAVMKRLEPVEVVAPKKVVKKVEESFYFRNKPLEEIMGMLAEWNDLEVIYEDDFLRKILYGGSISKSQSLERTLEVIELSGGLRFMVQGKKVFVLRIVR